jgi:hypothetical protein
VTPEELGRLFESFTVSAFRLECLPSYDVTEDNDREAFRRFRNKNDPPSWWSGNRGWCATVQKAVARGAVVRRVRLVDTPMNDYQRFEFEWSYPHNEQAGEQIFMIEDSPVVRGPVSYEDDFWLFDDATVVLLRYNSRGKFLGVESVEDAERYCRMRDRLIAKAQPFREYDPDQYPLKAKRGRPADLR